MTTTTLPVSADEAWSLCDAVDSANKKNGYDVCYPDGWDASPDWTNSNPHDGLFAIAAQRQSDGQLAIAIQGTQNFLDVLKDFAIVPQKEFEPIADAMISKGSHNGLSSLLRMKDDEGKTLESFLKSLSSGTNLLITGHSLGGNLSSILAPWIAANISAFAPAASDPCSPWPKTLGAITFAAPTAGNSCFAECLNRQDNYQAYFNTNDVVPHVWATTGDLTVDGIRSLFPPGPDPDQNYPHPAPDYVDEILSKKESQMEEAGVSYQQTRGTYFSYATQPDISWIEEVGVQHNQAYDDHFSGSK